MMAVTLHPTRCAICDTENNATELYPASFDLQAFNAAVFSARRLPNGTHYRFVKCNACGLVRSDPIADCEVLAQLYAQSTFDYADEVANLRAIYGRYLASLSRFGAKKGALLEIGCGNGFFLEEALAQGYTTVRGVEPSAEAVAKAAPQVRPHILCDIMHPGLFDAEQFDVICMFQVFDHILDPAALLNESSRVLAPGGMILCLNHNVEAFSARILKERSPIVDIGHTYLYSPRTLSRMFTAHGFAVRHVGSVFNRYTVRYLAHLAPIPRVLKGAFLAFLKFTRVGRIRIFVPLGHLWLVAQKGR